MSRGGKRRIPEFESIEEEAEFWDKHDTTAYEAEFRPVKVRFAKNLSQAITVRLDPDTLAALRELAHSRGIGPTTLARMWIVERLSNGEQTSDAGVKTSAGSRRPPKRSA